MTIERRFQALLRRAQGLTRADRRAIAREHFGRCLCGVSLAEHFDRRNQFVACHALQPTDLRARRASEFSSPATHART